MRWTARTATTAASGLAATAGALLVASIVCRHGRQSRIIDPTLRVWARAWLVPAGVRLRVEGVENIERDQAYVVVSNHQSNLDPMAHLAGLPLPLRFLAMRALFDVPLLGPVLRNIGMVEVDRDDPDMTAIRAGTERLLAAGTSVLIYPEGKTSGDGSIDSFHNGAFVLAVANEAPLLPVTLLGTRAVWTPGSNAIRRGTVRIIIGEPLVTAGLTARDAVRMRDEVRDWIVATCLDRDASRT